MIKKIFTYRDKKFQVSLERGFPKKYLYYPAVLIMLIPIDITKLDFCS